MAGLRIYAPKPQAGPLERVLRGDKYERSRAKAAAVGAVAPHVWSADGVDYELVAAPVVSQTPLGSGMVTLRVLASVGGVPLPMRGMHPFQFVNPPIKVRDGTWRVVTDANGVDVDVANTRENAVQALREMVAEHIRILMLTGKGGTYGDMAEARLDATRATGTTTTAYSSTEDGFVRSTSTTYSTARSGGTLALNTTANIVVAGQLLSTPDYSCYEGFIDPDTSAIPDGDDISSAVLSLYGNADNSTTDFTANARLRDWGTTLETADWVAGASLSALTLLATFASTGFVVGAYSDFTSDAAFIANVSKTGETRIIITSARHEAGTTPTGEEYLRWDAAEVAGTTQDPKLVVVHAAAEFMFPSRQYQVRSR